MIDCTAWLVGGSSADLQLRVLESAFIHCHVQFCVLGCLCSHKHMHTWYGNSVLQRIVCYTELNSLGEFLMIMSRATHCIATAINHMRALLICLGGLPLLSIYKTASQSRVSEIHTLQLGPGCHCTCCCCLYVCLLLHLARIGYVGDVVISATRSLS